MLEKKDYYFQVSLSKQAYMSKEETRAAITGGSEGRKMRNAIGMTEKLCFRAVSVTPEGLLNKVLNGYTFCGLFGDFRPNDKDHTYIDRYGYFTLSGKTSGFFKGSYCIGVDIDETRFEDTNELIKVLTLPPTFWYTSLSNKQLDPSTGESKGLRMRLIYVFDCLIQDEYYFRYCSFNLHQLIESDLEESIKDKCGLSCTQYFNGTTCTNKEINTESGLTNFIYSLSDVNVSEEGYFDFLSKNCYYKSPTQKQVNDISDILRLHFSHSTITKQQHTQVISEWEKSKQNGLDCESVCVFDDKLIRDAYRLDVSNLEYDAFFKKYKHEYPYVYRVENANWLEFGNVRYQMCDESYLELPWISNILYDGHHRRSTLFHRGWLRRIIMPEISPSALLFNFIVDRYRFFDNRDGVLNTSCLIEKVKECFRLTVEEYINSYPIIYSSTKETSRKKKFIIHWTSRKNANVYSLTKQLKWAFLDSVYDVSLSPMENLRVFLDSDIDITKSTLYRYLKERNIPKTKKDGKYHQFKEYHKDGMTLREEAQYFDSKGIHISPKTISIYREKLQNEANDT